MARPLTRRERWFVGVGTLLVLVIAAVAAVMFRPQPPTPLGYDASTPRPFTNSDGPVTAFAERLRRDGLPTTLHEAADRGLSKDSREGGIGVRLAVEPLLFHFELNGQPRIWPWGGMADRVEDETPENLAELTAMAPRLDEVVEAVAKAMTAPGCRLAVDDDGGQASAVRTLSALRRALAAAAVVGPSAERRLDACRCLLLVGRRDEPYSLLSLMGDTALLRVGVQSVRHGVEHGAIDAAAARRTLDQLLTGSALDRLADSLNGECADALDLYRRAIGTLLLTDTQRATVAQQTVDSCEAMRTIAALPRTPISTFLRSARPAATIDAPLAKALPSCLRKLAECDASTRLARVALAAAEHRVKHGDFPASLDELAPMFEGGVPLDPFTDAPFLYERTATGVRIASLGRLPEEAPLDDEDLREKCLVWELKR